MPRFCIAINEDGAKCTMRSGFNIPGKSAAYCQKHSSPDMINTNNKRCTEKSCYFEAKYGKDGEKPVRCEAHKLEEDINLKNSSLQCVLCKKRASFNYADKEKAEYCKEHSKDGMMNINHKNDICQGRDDCESPPCAVRASFGYTWERKVIMCRTHAKHDMINLVSYKCDECDLIASFANISLGEKKPTKCSIHKTDTMIDVVHCCGIKDCYLKAEYGSYGKTAIRCVEHKEEYMIRSRKEKVFITCKVENCPKEAKYNFKSAGVVLYCSEHKEINMCDITHLTSLCKEDDCIVRASFGYVKPEYCKEHKEDGMKDLVHSNCEICGIRATFGFSKDELRRCSSHSLTSMRNFCLSLCKSCNLITASLDKNTLCSSCFHFKYPNHVNTTRKHSKEISFTHMLSDLIKNDTVLQEKVLNISFDKVISGGCSRRRPDMLIELDGWNIIVEIDENKHQRYDNICEQTRLNELFTDLADQKLTLIRLNPDDYFVNNKKVLSAFTITRKEGLLKAKPTEYKRRFNKLFDVVYKEITSPGVDLFTEIKLFFDDYQD